MGALRSSFFFSILFLVMVHPIVPVVYSEISETEVVSALTSAEEAAASAFVAVLEAERAGGNVSKLLVRLNDAAEGLSKAEISYRLGNYEAAISFSAISSGICTGVRSDAEELRLQALGPKHMQVWLRMIESVLGAAIVGIGGFWSWRLFKRRYFERILRMKPEVSFDES